MRIRAVTPVAMVGQLVVVGVGLACGHDVPNPGDVADTSDRLGDAAGPDAEADGDSTADGDADAYAAADDGEGEAVGQGATASATHGAAPPGIVRVAFSELEDGPASFPDAAAAARAGCVLARLEAPVDGEHEGANGGDAGAPGRGGERHCVLAFSHVGDVDWVMDAVVYERARSGAFVRADAVLRDNRYEEGTVSLAAAFADGRQLVAVTYRTSWGTGIGETTYELLVWNEGRLGTAFRAPISCFLNIGGYEVEHHFEPSLHVPELQSSHGCDGDFPTVLELSHVYAAGFRNWTGTEALDLDDVESLKASWKDVFEWHCESSSFVEVARRPRPTRTLREMRSALLGSCGDIPE